MLQFAWPWIFLFLPLPLLARRFLPPRELQHSTALKVPFLDDFASSAAQITAGPQRFWLAAAMTLCWLLLVTASARPVWLGESVQLPVSGRDLVLAVDLSGSMEVKDFQLDGQAVDRLTAAKQVAGEFIERRRGDRLGLILFGLQAYLQTPLTFDRQTVRTLLDEAVIGLAGQKTAIGDAIGLALKRLDNQPDATQVLILLTDGANTAGEIEPLKAAELASDAGLKIYTIGIGAEQMEVRSFFGSQLINPSSELDEKTLRQIAELTDGQYFRARDTDELKEIYAILDRLEPVIKEEQSYRPQTALYHWPLATALLIATLLFIWRFNVTPWPRRSVFTGSSR